MMFDKDRAPARDGAIRSRSCAMAVLVALAGASGVALGAEAAADSRAGQLDEITVTATRRSTDLQQTPMTIDALSSETLEKTNVQSFNDFLMQVPSLSAEDLGPGNKRYAIRNIQAAGEAEVGLYYDEIPIAGLAGENNDAGNQQPDLNLFDVERIEVLKGPQGTLYGAGSMGGTIRVISKRPNLANFESEALLNLGDVSHGGNNVGGDVMLNVPLINDVLGARFVGFYHRNAGYIDELHLGIDDANSVDSYGGRASFRARPSEHWTVDLIGYVNETHVKNTFQQTPFFGDWNDNNFAQTPRKDEFQGYNLISTNDFSFASLTVLASYQRRTVDQRVDSTAGVISILARPCDVFNYVQCLPANGKAFGLGIVPTAHINQIFAHAWSGEVRLQSVASSKTQWTIGAFGQDRYDFNQTFFGGPTAADGSTSINPATGLAVGSIFARQNWDPLKQYAAFGEVTYPLLPTLDATAGARWTHGSRSDLYQQIQNFGDRAPYGPGTGLYPETKHSESAFTPKVQLSYHPSENYLYYVLASKGFRLGGPNVPAGFSAVEPPPYESDSLWNYEVGYKTAFFDRRMTVNGAVFWIDWSNIQQAQTDPTGRFSFIGNGGKAVAKGVELDINSQVTNALQLRGAVSYTHAALVGPQPAQVSAQNVKQSGDNFPYTPKWTGAVSADYQLPFGTLNPYVRADVAYRSGQNTAFNNVNPAYAQLAGFVVANLRLGISFDKYEAQLYATNLFDRVTEIGGVPLSSGGLLQTVSTPPRTVGLLLRVGF